MTSLTSGTYRQSIGEAGLDRRSRRDVGASPGFAHDVRRHHVLGREHAGPNRAVIFARRRARVVAEAPLERNAPYAPTPDNRPKPLEVAPLPLACDALPQMSFGERAALEGVLAQLRPGLALELGTAEGGSLRRIAANSGEVHSIDLDHEPVHSREPLPGHVSLHTGASAELLPPLLRSFEESNRSLDFVLVDGDHSFEGARGDIEALLRSPVTRRTVILVHDSMNAEVRAGIESVGLNDYEKVVYQELDFVPGYIYAEGVAQNSVWGGLALVMTDVRRSPGYTQSTRQSLYHEPFHSTHRTRAELLRQGA